MSPRRRRSAARTFASRLLLVVLLVGGALLATEGILRWRAPRHDGYLLFPPGVAGVFEPAPGVMPGISGPSRFRSNRDGLRAEEPSPHDDVRVLCIGGSTTACVFLDQDEAWPAVLQERLREGSGLRVWVGNAGKDGMTSRDHVIQMERIVPRVPDLDVIVLLAGVNDLLLRLSQQERYDPRYMERAHAESELLAHVFTVRPDPDAGPFAGSALWRSARALFAERPAEHRLMDPQGEWYVGRRALRRRAGLLDALPDLSTALQEYGRNLARVADLADAAGIRLVLVTQPSIYGDDLSPEVIDLLWLGGKGDFMNERVDEYYAVPALRAGLEAYNEVTRRVASLRGLQCIDLAAALPRDLSVYYDDVHFNESGARQVAEVLAQALLGRPPFVR